MLVTLAVLAACERPVSLPLRTDDGTLPNVLVLTIDTLRADHLGVYGYPTATSPRIDELARTGIRFSQTMSTASETAPGVASILTGLYQQRSRVFQNRNTLTAVSVPLAEVLQHAGYSTAAFVGNELVNADRGFDQGFDHFETHATGKELRPSDGQLVDAAVTWLEGTSATPWHVWLHLMDPHGPYLSDGYPEQPELHYPENAFGDATPVAVADSNFVLGMIPRYQGRTGLTRLSEYVRLYDGEIRFTDTQIGRLLDALTRLEQRRDTLIVLTADHGESLTEHEEYLQHGWYLYDTTTRVPLILSWPAHLPEGVVIEAQASVTDLVPTLIALLGLSEPGNSLVRDGESLARVVAREKGAEPRHPAFAVGARDNHPFSIRHQGWKLILTPADRPASPDARPAPAPERVELFDLRTDPGETRNVVADHPERAAGMRARLDAFRKSFQLSGRHW